MVRLIIVCGHPAAGKSTVVARLVEHLHAAAVAPVVVVGEAALHLVRDAAYADVTSEKNTRGAIRSAVDRLLATDAGVVILDSLNFIKGYRYELWCCARSAGARYCMVHVDTDVLTCRDWNRGRPEGERYGDAVFEDLAGRFERPDARNRWDAPLFTLRPAGDPLELEAGLRAVVTACAGGVAGAAAAHIGPGAGGNDAPDARPPARDLRPALGTSKPLMLSTNLLHDLDAAVQEVVDAVTAAQAGAGPGAPPGVVRLTLLPPPAALRELGLAQQDEAAPEAAAQGPAVPSLQFDAPVSLADLRRHKRAFLKLATKVTFTRLSDAAAARRMFVDFLIDNVPGASRPHVGFGT